MTENNINEAFENAYNNFNNRPLTGKTLKDFYIDEFTKDAVKKIKKRVIASKGFDKMLVIGHRGCGKSTILNKVAEELQDKFHIVSFSGEDKLDITDVETIDILISIYLEVLNSMQSLNSPHENKVKVALETLNNIMESVKDKLKITEVGVNLLKILSFKIRVENESRHELRQQFKNQIKKLDDGIYQCINIISEYYQERNIKGKDVLIIIDDLDKLDTEFAEKIFFKNSQSLTMLRAKIIYTFPLDTYYSASFRKYKDDYKDEYISLVVVDQQKNGDIGIQQLEKLVLKRIDARYITKESLTKIIIASGGLLRDLIRFMQDACAEAMFNDSEIINEDIATLVINEAENEYYRLFDFPKYLEEVKKLTGESSREKLENEKLIELLHNLFVLEYRFKGKLWYEPHPCLNKVINDY